MQLMFYEDRKSQITTSPTLQIPPVIEKGTNNFLRFSAMSNAGFEVDGLQKTNQDSFVSIMNLGDQALP